MPRKSDFYSEIEISSKEAKELKEEILTQQHPLGNYAFEFVSDRFNSSLFQMLFNWHPEQFHEDDGIRPSIILGRRGSGKSSYLNNLSHKEQVIAVPIKSWDVVNLVESQVKEILEDFQSLDSERVAEIWQLIFLTLATSAAVKAGLQTPELKKLLSNLPIENIAKATIPAIAAGVMNHFKSKYLNAANSTFSISLIFESMKLGYDTLDHWETAISDLAKSAHKYVILMIDNPELLDNRVNTVEQAWADSYSESSKARWYTYAGLLRLLSQFNKGKVGVQIRYCVAAEQYFYLQDRSTANLKDFGDIQVLHWSSGDLLSSLAHRYMIFLQLSPQNRSNDRYETLRKFPIYTGSGAKEFFRFIFGETLENDRGYAEDVIAYLLRHTQLLPRQMILYVNAAMKGALTENKAHDLTKLDPQYIKTAIRENEQILAVEIIQSFASALPEGGELVNSLRGFPILANFGDLCKNWKKYGATKVLKKFEAFPGITTDSDRFFKVLFEIGVLGRQDSSKNGEYIEATYEYTLPLRLRADVGDTIVVHPLFSIYTDRTSHAAMGNKKGIYPRGTDIGDNIPIHVIKQKYVSRKD
jgi:hypothetical protein